MPDFDPFSAMVVDEPTALEMAKARAAALRGQNYAGLVMGLAHDPNAARIGGQLSQQAQTGLSDLGNMPGERLKMALGRQKLQQEGPQPELEGQTPSVYKLLTARKEAEANRALREQLARMPSLGVNAATGQLYNKHGNIVPQDVPAPGAPTPAQPLVGKFLDKALKELGADFDPSGGRSGEFGKNQARVNAANRLLALATDESGNAKDLNPQQMPELSQALASLISGGGAGAQAQIEHLTPKTLRGDFQRTMQWLMGNPRGADQVAFVQNMIETAKRERETAGQAIESVRGQRGAKHQRVIMGNPQEAGRVLQGFGWELGPDGMPVMKATTAATPKKSDDLRKKYGL